MLWHNTEPRYISISWRACQGETTQANSRFRKHGFFTSFQPRLPQRWASVGHFPLPSSGYSSPSWETGTMARIGALFAI